jgi:fumarate reductase flavoprotein subunit
VRFVDEGWGNGPYMANALVRQKDRTCFTIIDSETKRHLQENGVESLTYMDTDSPKIGDLDADIKSALTEGLDYAYVADSIKALAAKIKVNAIVLQRTIDEYNRFCDKGHDDLFAKDPKFLRPVRKPPFYAFRRSPSGYGTIGGIKINEKAEAMGQDNEAIFGLFAAGDCANGTHTYDYPLVYILWGSTLGFAINSGRIAGESAADYIKTVK